MNSLIIGIITTVLIASCFILGFLVLIQLPKKEAGLGQAFGSGTTDALFGAGSGNVLTQATKYAAGSFMVCALILSWLVAHQAHEGKDEFQRALQKKAQTAVAPALPGKLPGMAPAVPATATTVPAAPRATIHPSPASVAYAVSTVPRAAPNCAARLRADGKRSPGRTRPLTIAMRVRS